MKRYLSLILALCIMFSVMPITFASAADFEMTDIERPDVNGYGFAPTIFYDENGNVIAFDGRLTYNTGFQTMGTSMLPSAYDSRDKGVITPVKNQGASGNCWAFASTSVLETNSIVNGYTTLDSTDFAESHLAWFSVNTATSDVNDPNYGEGGTGNAYSEGGNSYMVTRALARWAGVADGKKVTSNYPTTQSQLSKLPKYTDADRYDTSSGVVIKSMEQCDTAEEVKQWIIDHGSITAAYFHSDSLNYIKDGSGYTAYCYTGDDNPGSNHMITVVGWDDNFSASKFNSKSKPEGNGAWLCKNSWGTSWGNGKGYFWISYYDKTIAQFYGFTTQSADKFDNNYTYNADYYNYLIGDSSKETISNVFTVKYREDLTAISLYTQNDDVTVKVSIYNNIPLSEESDPTNGELAQSFTVNLPRIGYHTIDLPEAVSLEHGYKFSVVLELSIASGTLKIPLEGGNDRTATEGQSFVLKYNKWRTTQSLYYSIPGKNLYIQAFTVSKCDHLNQETVVKVYDDCINQGYERVVCTDCNGILSEKLFPLKDHIRSDWIIEKEPSCIETGLSVKKCTMCGMLFESQEIPMLEHTPGEWIIEKETSCTHTGLTVKRCTKCDQILETKDITMLDHTAGDWVIERNPSCTALGLLVRKCTACKLTLESLDIPMVDHEYRYSVINEPTCSEYGTGKYTCAVCRGSYQVNIEPTGEHVYSEWESVKEPTPTEDGEKAHSCNVCSKTESVVIKALGFETNEGTNVDYLTGVISGIRPGETSLDTYVELVNESYTWEYENRGRLGTGTKAVLKNGDETVGEYTVLLYGDINGDGWYDGEDAVIVNCLVNNMLSKENMAEVCYQATDCNRNGYADINDVTLLNNAGLLLASVNQSLTAQTLFETSMVYADYIDIIDQSVAPDETENQKESTVGEMVTDSENTEISFNIIEILIGLITGFLMKFSDFL